jgi:hypothetical protein
MTQRIRTRNEIPPFHPQFRRDLADLDDLSSLLGGDFKRESEVYAALDFLAARAEQKCPFEQFRKARRRSWQRLSPRTTLTG